ncbi:CdaR family protein [Vallitalea sp.]|jgi:YbbR domain-containing protein|uniref:CdaR family protein n=1 Tax=Vallitalea sp. TaxID=1882829 RepID=UPI0025D3C041|nr:CdaR family protein [Vallitalea sp.]MCT4686485.1 CdaR family protein [Vallitalea sp.]
MGNIFSRNVGWKIASIVIAFFVWFAIVQVEDPYITKDFKNIPVKVLNERVITSKNQYINFIEGQYVDVTLGGKRKIIERFNKEDIIATVDMQYLSFTDTLVIDIKTNNEAITVVKKSPNDMRITRENIKSEIRQITYEFEGNPKESYIHLDPIITPNTVEIEGAESKMAQVKEVKVTFGIDGATNDVTSVGKIRLLDKNGNEISDIDKSIEEVNYQVPIRKLKKVNVLIKTTGSLPSGYKLTGSEVNPNKVTLIGEETAIDKINNLVLQVPLNNVTADVNKEIDLATVLPVGVSRYQNTNMVTVKLNVDKVQEKDVVILTHDISIDRLPENLNISIVNTEDIKVKFRGIQEDLNRITVYSLNPTINLNNLEEGIHEVTLGITYPRSVELVTEIPKVIIELTNQDQGVADDIQDNTGDMGEDTISDEPVDDTTVNN